MKRRYSRFIFLSFHKIDTSDKRLAKNLTADNLEFFAGVLMVHWTTHETFHLDLDKKFTEDVRDFKSFLGGEKSILETYKKLVIEKLSSSMEEKTLSNLSGKIIGIIKALLKIGSGISKSKEFEDILDDLMDKVVDTCNRIPLTLKELNDFFSALVNTFDRLMEKVDTRHRQRFTESWFKFLEGIRQCVTLMYDLKLS